MQSSWYEAFRADMRSNVVVRAVEASLGGVGSVTSAASSWTSASLSTASRSLRHVLSRYTHHQQSCHSPTGPGCGLSCSETLSPDLCA